MVKIRVETKGSPVAFTIVFTLVSLK